MGKGELRDVDIRAAFDCWLFSMTLKLSGEAFLSFTVELEG